MAPRFVAPYRKNGKNDGNDAEAICEAVSRPSMRFVPITTRSAALLVRPLAQHCHRTPGLRLQMVNVNAEANVHQAKYGYSKAAARVLMR
jgi:transposase